ncbi:NUDIX domain-containing protein [Aliikangiella marina]|uniref:8-oxo-dGTP diphosphatase n=1 Tax=Aliikangiella marina TaxID=1712262 RepID=A0A545TGZ2_9GAMM|nr:NUDIX domain-containing protein [Aliikangiella marina]TQV76502.1 NUDIX domain-containing protein [Aliikangiella marina]
MSKYLKLVSGVLQQADNVLLGLRKNTEYYSGFWAFPCGRLESGENFVDALRRELFEETGIQMIDGENLTTLFDHEQQIEHEVFQVTEWRGEPINREPQLCQELRWFPLTQLPTPITPATLKILMSLVGENSADQ